jgi:hypothetical protein
VASGGLTVSQLTQLLSEFAVPLQVWLTPEARRLVADTLIARMGARAEIHTNPLSVRDEIRGPAVLVIASTEINGAHSEDLKVLSRAAHPGRAVLVGGTADRDTLMAAINDWGVVRVVPANPDPEVLVTAVRDAEAYLKREVALVTAIDDLDIQTTMISSAIDHIEDGQEQSRQNNKANATTTFASGLSTLLERERGLLATAATTADGDRDPLDNAAAGLQLLCELVDKSHDRAIEHSAGMSMAEEGFDDLIETARRITELQTGLSISGHLGSGASTKVDPFSVVHVLIQLAHRTPLGAAMSIESYRSGDTLVLECRYKEPTAGVDVQAHLQKHTWSTLTDSGVQMAHTPADPYTLRLVFPSGQNNDV